MKLNQPDWSSFSHSLALTAELPEHGMQFHMIWNAYWEPLEFELPPLSGAVGWRRWIDTVLDTPNDIVDWQAAVPVAGRTYMAGPRSVVVLVADEK